MYPFTIPKIASPKQAAHVIGEFGLLHMDGFLTGNDLAQLTAECRRIVDSPPAWSHPEAYSIGTAVRLVRKEIDRSTFPMILAVFEQPFLEQIVAEHYGEGYVFAEQVYTVHDVVGSETIVQQLHHDKIEHLKIFIYLSDVGEGNGPFHCVPGSHRLTAKLQRDNRSRGIIATDTEARALPSELARQEVAVVGGRGTLIVFNSDLAHRAGVPTTGDRLGVRSLNFGPQSLGKRL